MRIGISFDMLGAAEKYWGDEKYKMIKELGYSAVDFNMSDTDTRLYSAGEDELAEMLLHEKKLAAEAGTEIFQVHGPWRWPPRDFEESDRAERMEKMKKSIAATAVLGCKNWVVHPIMPFGIEDIGTENEPKTWQMNLDFMSELLKTAKENGVIICLENMPMHKFSMAAPEQILKFVKEINDDNFKICLDTGHVSVFPKLSVGDEVRRLGNEIKVFHIHDNKFEMDLHMMPHFGIIDWGDFSKSLRDVGYVGVFSLELAVPRELSRVDMERWLKMGAGVAEDIIGS